MPGRIWEVAAADRVASQSVNEKQKQEATASSTSYLILGLKEFTKVGESPTRPWSRLSCFKTTTH